MFNMRGYVLLFRMILDSLLLFRLVKNSLFRFIINNDIIFLYDLFFVDVCTCSIVKIILQIYTIVIYW
jgi:hypothetical protein